jgi:pyruvate/2-oxoglutarate dehydrogenase complex dihydrolipoamide dehydrogenase (E3) component
VLGLELADSLLKRGCRVSVIEGAERLLPRNLDAAGSDFAAKQMTATENLDFLPGKVIKEIREKAVVYIDRTAGRYCHHRHSGGDASACFAAGPGTGSKYRMSEQYATAGLRRD